MLFLCPATAPSPPVYLYDIGGCSGYSYNLNYVKKGDATISKDELVKQHGVNVFVDPKAVFFIVGTEMDYVVRSIK